MDTRPAAVAGLFYPADPQQLHDEVHSYLQDAAGDRTDPAVPKTIIAPHAGYAYSGSIAASAYTRLLAAHSRIRRVVLLGPSHRVPFTGLAASSARVFDTPLGPITLDRAAIAQLDDLPQVTVLDEAHAQEHSLEVQLPFLQEVLDDFELVPLVVGEASPTEVAEVLDRLWGGPETLIVISSDLSHYHPYEEAQRLDRHTSEAIEALRPEAIHSDDACGGRAVNGLLTAAKKHGLHAHTVDLRNSFDTAGDSAGNQNRVVGYGAYVFH